MNKKLFSCLIFFLFSPVAAFACVAPPADFIVDHNELERRTETIVLAIALGGSGVMADVWGDEYELMQFERIEVLKGRTPLRFTIPNGFELSQVRDATGFEGGSLETDYDGHRDPKFWEQKYARQWNTAACALLPTFTVGNRYLLFLGTPHWQGYERIRSDDDAWLEAVRDMVGEVE